MNRLLQGEVGSGKTLVALRAMLRVVDSGRPGRAARADRGAGPAAPPLHHRAARRPGGRRDARRGGEATDVELLTGSMTKAQRTEPLSRLATGEAGIVIGTHALLEEQVQFFDLGLVVVDEQHRFGVEQRAALTDKAGTPAARAGDDRDADPAHRRDDGVRRPRDLHAHRAARRPRRRSRPTSCRSPSSRTWIDRVWQRVREEVEKGHQAYVVCPRISGDELEQGEVDPDVRRRPGRRPGGRRRRHGRWRRSRRSPAELAERPLAGLRVAPLHGRMPPEEKDRTMRAFAAGEIDVLVATTVIEVGVDVANATTMVLMDADRFGISQLHQLRGRVGRGGLPGLCLLVSHAAAGTRRPRAARRGRRHHRRLRAEPGRPRAAPRGRRARPLPVRLPLQPPEPPRAARREDHRGRPRRRRGAARRRRRPWRSTRSCARECPRAGGVRPRASSSRSRRDGPR